MTQDLLVSSGGHFFPGEPEAQLLKMKICLSLSTQFLETPAIKKGRAKKELNQRTLSRWSFPVIWVPGRQHLATQRAGKLWRLLHITQQRLPFLWGAAYLEWWAAHSQFKPKEKPHPSTAWCSSPGWCGKWVFMSTRGTGMTLWIVSCKHSFRKIVRHPVLPNYIQTCFPGFQICQNFFFFLPKL